MGETVGEYGHEVPATAELLESGHYRVSSRLPVGELGELFDILLQGEETDTVGGLMVKLLNVVSIPGSGATCEGVGVMADHVVGRHHQIGTVPVCLTSKTSREEKKETSGWPVVPLRFRLLRWAAQRGEIHLDQRPGGSKDHDRLLETPDH